MAGAGALLHCCLCLRRGGRGGAASLDLALCMSCRATVPLQDADGYPLHLNGTNPKDGAKLSAAGTLIARDLQVGQLISAAAAAAAAARVRAVHALLSLQLPCTKRTPCWAGAPVRPAAGPALAGLAHAAPLTPNDRLCLHLPRSPTRATSPLVVTPCCGMARGWLMSRWKWWSCASSAPTA